MRTALHPERSRQISSLGKAALNTLYFRTNDLLEIFLQTGFMGILVSLDTQMFVFQNIQHFGKAFLTVYLIVIGNRKFLDLDTAAADREYSP